MRNLLIVAGEASGDLYGAALAREIRRKEKDLSLWGCGGPRMEEAGVQLAYSIRDFSVLGFSEVIRKIPFFSRALSHMTALCRERSPAAAVLIDFPGFNMRLAARCKRLGIPVVYYISPQVWAWGRGRVDRLKQLVEKMLVILPFEEEIYREAGVPVRFVGHPLVDIARPAEAPERFRRRHRVPDGAKLVGLFPGSRRHEVERLLPVMAETARRLQSEGHPVHPLIGAAPALEDEVYRSCDAAREIATVRNQTYELLEASSFALVASGTMTMEAACMGTPMAVLYRVSTVSYWIGRALVRVPHVAMVNILAGERVVPEFLQHQASWERVLPVVREWLVSPEKLAAIRERLGSLRPSLGDAGASERAAEEVLRIAGRAP